MPKVSSGRIHRFCRPFLTVHPCNRYGWFLTLLPSQQESVSNDKHPEVPLTTTADMFKYVEYNFIPETTQVTLFEPTESAITSPSSHQKKTVEVCEDILTLNLSTNQDAECQPSSSPFLETYVEEHLKISHQLDHQTNSEEFQADNIE